MQNSSAEFETAIEAPTVLFTPPTVAADWESDGYGSVGTIDDLTDQIGGSYEVIHEFDDGLPSQITSSSEGNPASELSAPIGGRTVSGEVLDASQYFSPFNTDSPVYGLARDVAPVKLSQGVVTSNGIEEIRLFTGQMVDLPVEGSDGTLHAISKTRLNMSKAVQPPPVFGRVRGANASWLVSWTLNECGINVSPPPRAGCRYWNPLHGSLQAFTPKTPSSSEVAKAVYSYWQDTVLTEEVRPTWIGAPYLLGNDAYMRLGNNLRVEVSNITLATGPHVPFLSGSNSRGRIELWMKADLREVFSTPNPPAQMLKIELRSPNGTGVVCGVDGGFTNNIFIEVDDGTGTFRLEHSSTWPADNEWHFLGFAYSFSGDKLWVRLDSTTETSTPALTTANLQSESWDAGSPSFVSYMPTTELQLTSGNDADPDVTPTWMNAVYIPNALVRRSWLELEAIAEPVAREAWDLLASLARSDLALIRTDEFDSYQYLPRAYFVENAPQTIQEVVSTASNAKDLQVAADPTKIRNSITVKFQEVVVDTVPTPVLSFSASLLLPIGKSERTFSLDNPTVSISTSSVLTNLTESQVDNETHPTNASFVSINVNGDGTGTYLSSALVSATIKRWDPGSVTIEFNNLSRTRAYLVNDGNSVPFLQVVGLTVNSFEATATASDPDSIAERGERSMEISLDALQRRDDAGRVAGELLGMSAQPHSEITVEVFGDPRRQPGDLVTLLDANRTEVSGKWRVLRVRHKWDSALFTQTLFLRKEFDIGIWDSSNWNEVVWGA